MRRQEWLLPAGLSPKVGTRPPLLVGCPAGGSPLWVSPGWAAPLKTVSLGGGELSLYLGILRRRRFQSRGGAQAGVAVRRDHKHPLLVERRNHPLACFRGLELL